MLVLVFLFSYNDPPTTYPYTLSLTTLFRSVARHPSVQGLLFKKYSDEVPEKEQLKNYERRVEGAGRLREDRKSTRSELQSHSDLVCRLLLEKKKNKNTLRLMMLSATFSNRR